MTVFLGVDGYDIWLFWGIGSDGINSTVASHFRRYFGVKEQKAVGLGKDVSLFTHGDR